MLSWHCLVFENYMISLLPADKEDKEARKHPDRGSMSLWNRWASRLDHECLEPRLWESPPFLSPVPNRVPRETRPISVSKGLTHFKSLLNISAN